MVNGAWQLYKGLSRAEALCLYNNLSFSEISKGGARREVRPHDGCGGVARVAGMAV